MQRLPDDNHGRAVYIIKASTMASSLTPSGTRALFYQFHLLSETGCILLLVDDASDKIDTDTSLTDLKTFFGVLSALVCKALPLKVVRVIIISSPSTTTPTRSMHSECAQLIVKNSLSTQVVLMKEDSPQEFVDKLQSFGLTKAGFPSVLGGILASIMPPAAATAEGFSFDHPPYESYRSNATHFGSRAYAPPVSPAEEWSASISTERLFPPPTLKRTATHSRQEEAVVVADKKAKKETEDRRLKERNALYSRRKYERKKVEIEVMKKRG